MNQKTYQHWQIKKDPEQIVWLRLDRRDKSVNSISASVLSELETILSQLATDNQATGLVIGTAKNNGFSPGADLEAFKVFTTQEQAFELIHQGQQIFHQLSQLTIPTVAEIKGFCLGGGLELALACRYRVLVEDDKPNIGLPEVRVGIHPGWGGTVALPKLIGSVQALDLILSGRTVRAKDALRLGIVDYVVPERNLTRAVKFCIQQKPAPRVAPKYEWIFHFQFARQLFARYLRSQVAQKAREQHYPAPYAVIDNWEQYGVNHPKSFEVEAQSVGRLATTETSKNLLRVFFLQELLKNQPKDQNFRPTRVHVIGAGTMGADIAAWCALQGMQVSIQDREAGYLAKALARANQMFQKKLKNPRLIQAALDRIFPDLEGVSIPRADVIIEAIHEDSQAKRDLFKKVESLASEHAILATNTSSIPLEQINTVLRHPERLVGLHFFNPVSEMQLVEIVKGPRTTDAIVEKALAFVRRIERLPLIVKSAPGFLVNRILMPYLMEAVTLLDEGVPASVIDKAALEFGMPIGPVELADKVGLDICLSVANYLSGYFGGTPPERLKQMVERGELGVKTKKGFYQYDKKGKPQRVKLSSEEREKYNLDDITDRLILRLENEAVACLREAIVASDDLLDAGMIFGTGFAPFRGGPINYARARGIFEVRQQLQKLQSQYGARFQADAEWQVLKTE